MDYSQKETQTGKISQSCTCTALVLIFSLALLFIDRSAFLNKQSVGCCDISSLPHLLGVSLTLSVLDCLTSLLTLGLAEALSAPTGAPHQLAVLPGHRLH